MTLVLSCATPEFVVQVADRRVVLIPDGDLIDDARNKVTMFCNKMAFSFAGLARDQRDAPTDEWIAKVLYETGAETLGDATQSLCSEAVKAFSPSRHISKHYLVGVGWARITENKLLPTIWEANNEDEESFEQTKLIVDGKDAEIRATPRLSPDRLKSLHRNVQQCVNKNLSPMSIIKLMAREIRWTSTRNDRVGKSLLAVCIPKCFASGTMTGLVQGSAATIDTLTTFWDIPEFGFNPKTIGPNFVCEGFQAINFSITRPSR